jgi:hypothetical protein
LLKLYKFGDPLPSPPSPPSPPPSPAQETPKKEPAVIQYSSIAKQHDKNKPGFTIKLLDCANDTDAASPREHHSPFRENPKRHLEHMEVARLFHTKPLDEVGKGIFKEMELGNDYDEADRAGICDLILKSDAFMIESFVRRRGKKAERVPVRTVKYIPNYPGSICERWRAGTSASGSGRW